MSENEKKSLLSALHNPFALPDWVPVKPLMACIIFMIVSLTVAVAVQMWLISVRNTLTDADYELQGQRAMRPVLGALRTQHRNLKGFIDELGTIPKPASLNSSVDTLRRMAQDNGIRSAEFAPVAASVIADGSVLIKVRVEGGVEQIRSFVLSASCQPWITAMEYPEIQAAGTARVLTTDFYVSYGRGLATFRFNAPAPASVRQ